MYTVRSPKRIATERGPAGVFDLHSGNVSSPSCRLTRTLPQNDNCEAVSSR